MAGALSAVVLGLPACASGQPAAKGLATGPDQQAATTQTSEAGQVAVKVTWPGRSAGLAFRVVLETHAVDLDGYDLTQLALLRTDRGASARPQSWDAPKGGHHREGTLRFPDTSAEGHPLVTPDTRALELIIRDVAGVAERTFRWSL